MSDADILTLFLTRGVNELTRLRDEAFKAMTSGEGAVVRSNVNGSGFEFTQSMSPSEIATHANRALQYKALGIGRAITRTTSRFA